MASLRSKRNEPKITAQLLLRAYAAGIFPMAASRDADSLVWISPEHRGILPLEGFHVPKRLVRTVRNDRFRVTVDSAFSQVTRNCATTPGRGETWINPEIESLYGELHEQGHAHSVECWQEDELVGGLYGVALGAAFFGESMFSVARDASKVALAHLVARLICGGFTLLDAQFITVHLTQFGAIEISRADYLLRLESAIAASANFYCPEPSGKSGTFSLARASGDVGLTGAMEATAGASWPGWLVLQLITQTS